MKAQHQTLPSALRVFAAVPRDVSFERSQMPCEPKEELKLMSARFIEAHDLAFIFEHLRRGERGRGRLWYVENA